MAKQNYKQQYQPQEPQLTQEQMIMAQNAIKNAVDIKCGCGSDIFTQGIKLKRISKLLTGDSQDTIIPISVAYCYKCSKELLLDNDSGESIIS